MPGTADNELLEFAEANRFILLTLDKDFLQLTLQRWNPLAESGVILFRMRTTRTEVLVPHVLKTVRQDIEWRGAISTVGPDEIERIPWRSRRK